MPLIRNEDLGFLELNTMYTPKSSVGFSISRGRGNTTAILAAWYCGSRKRVEGRHRCSLSPLAALANDLVLLCALRLKRMLKLLA